MSNKQKAVIIDCDEILLNHLGGFKKYVEKYHDIQTVGEPEQYNLQEWLQCDGEQVMDLLKNFNFYSYEFGLLEPMDQYVVDRMQFLEMFHPEVAFIVVTKSGTFGHGEVLRKVNLHNVFGDIFDDIIILENYQSKRGTYNLLSKKYDIVTVVDDHLANIDVALELGLDAVVLQCTHNTNEKDNPKYNFVTDWREMADYISLKIDGELL
jgi:FMN phosphatase YigB (HAD superfamily)